MSYLETKLKEWSESKYIFNLKSVGGYWAARLEFTNKRDLWKFSYINDCESAQQAVFQLEQKMQEALKENI